LACIRLCALIGKVAFVRQQLLISGWWCVLCRLLGSTTSWPTAARTLSTSCQPVRRASMTSLAARGSGPRTTSLLSLVGWLRLPAFFVGQQQGCSWLVVCSAMSTLMAVESTLCSQLAAWGVWTVFVSHHMVNLPHAAADGLWCCRCVCGVGFKVHPYYEDFSSPCFAGLHQLVSNNALSITSGLLVSGRLVPAPVYA
jgi:hypothetical protein